MQAQVVINEGSNKNYSSIADEEGDFTDWIELYNPSGSAVDLFNYTGVVIASFIRLIVFREANPARLIMALCFMTVCVKNLYFLRAFEATGPLGKFIVVYIYSLFRLIYMY